MLGKLSDLAKGAERLNAGSALKFCDVASGVADVYPRTSPCYEWDLAAGDALVRAAGGTGHHARGAHRFAITSGKASRHPNSLRLPIRRSITSS